MPWAPAAERAVASKPLSASSCAASSAGGTCSARAAAATRARNGTGTYGRDCELAGAREARTRQQQPSGAGPAAVAERLDADSRTAVRRFDGEPGRHDEADVMRRRAHEHEVAGLQRRGRERLRELLEPGRSQAPDGDSRRREGVVDEPRAVESALRPALAAPHVRPAELRERRGDDRAAGVEAAHVGEAEALCRGGLREGEPRASSGSLASRDDPHAHRDRRGVAQRCARRRSIRAPGPSRADARSAAARDAASDARGRGRRARRRRRRAVAALEDARRGQCDGIGRAVHALVEQQCPALLAAPLRRRSASTSSSATAAIATAPRSLRGFTMRGDG